MRKKKSSPCGPYFRGTVQTLDVVRKSHNIPVGPGEARRLFFLRMNAHVLGNWWATTLNGTCHEPEEK